MNQNTELLYNHRSHLANSDLNKETILQTDRRLRGAIIGHGYIASKGHLPAYQARTRSEDDVEIIAIADITPKRLEQAQRDTLHSVRLYNSYEEMLLKERANLDFVDVATPPSTHAEIINYALDLGLHVLCEKPITTTPREIQEIIQKAEQVQRVVFPVHNYKHAPVVKAINEIIESGNIGEVSSVTLQTFRNTHALGVPEWNPHWRRDHSYSGGGIAMDHGSHSFYLTFNWLNSYPLSVTANKHILRPNWSLLPLQLNQQQSSELYLDRLASDIDNEKNSHPTEDNFTATLKFPHGLANLHLSWTAGIRKVLYTVQGTRGAIIVDDDEMQIATMNTNEVASTAAAIPNSANGYGGIKWDIKKYSISSHWMDSGHTTWFNSLFNSFAHAIYAGDYINRELLEAALCVEVINAAYTSANNQSKEIAISQDLIKRINVGKLN